MADEEYVPDYIDIEIEEEGDECTIRLSGEIDVLVAPELRKLLVRSLAKSRVSVDMSSVTFIDSSGLGALIGARMTVPPEERDRLVVKNAPAAIHNLFEIAGVSHLLEGSDE